MLRRLALYWNTIRHLKWIQIRYQIIYRIKTKIFPFTYYKKYLGKPLFPVIIKTRPCIESKDKFLCNNKFHFLNLYHTFSAVDWNFNEYGKLWNYNLQYFDYLLDHSIPDIEKQKLIEDFSAAILSGRVKPEPYPISLRLINWIIYFSRTNYRSELFEKALQYQVGYLKHNLEFHILANHLIENYYALCITGLAFRDPDLINFSMQRIGKELDEQIVADGGHYECSPMYHCILLGKLLLIIDAVKNYPENNTNLNFLEARANKMLGWLDSICSDGETYSRVNDASPEIAPKPAQLFAQAAELGLHWTKSNLKESGYRKFCNSNFDILIDVGNIISSYQPGHTHSDIFNFTLNYKRNPVFIDSGTSTYENNKRRQYERSTIAHNSVVINQDNQSQMWGSFRVANRARVNISVENNHAITASHDGYHKKYGAIHFRQFSLKNDESFEIVDKIIQNRNCNISSVAYFHLDFTVSVVNFKENNIQLSNGLKIYFQNANTISIYNFHQAIEFNKLVNSQEIAVSFKHQLLTNIFKS